MSVTSLFAGACTPADSRLFFGSGETARQRRIRVGKATTICARCPVGAACLEYAQANRVTDGIWGGVDFGDEERADRMCGNGLHLMDTANTWVDPDGHKNCRTCRNEADRRRRDRRRQERGIAA